jgi:hypothetical protein
VKLAGIQNYWWLQQVSQTTDEGRSYSRPLVMVAVFQTIGNAVGDVSRYSKLLLVRAKIPDYL